MKKSATGLSSSKDITECLQMLHFSYNGDER